METHYNNPKLAIVRRAGNDVDEGAPTATDAATSGGLGVSSERNLVDDVASRPKADNSGLKLYYTAQLRKYDAGVLSIGMFLIIGRMHAIHTFGTNFFVDARTGMDPNWRHIIPPFHDRVVSEGHCVEGCTRKAFPRTGISIFAVMMRTHLIGKDIKLRHQRNEEEFAPIAHDRNVDPNYQEYRRLPGTVRAMPGDRLIAQCIYDSSKRDQITLGYYI